MPDSEIVLITSVKPNITREQAISKFRGRLQRLKHGRLRAAVDFYIPYRFFRTSWDDGRRKMGAFLAADAVTGKLDLIEFNQLPLGGEVVDVNTHLVAEERVRREEACEMVRDRIAGLAFKKRGFFRLSRLNVEVELAASLHIPYWVGVYERQEGAQIEIVNALQGQLEGAKLREIVAEWLHS